MTTNVRNTLNERIRAKLETEFELSERIRGLITISDALVTEIKSLVRRDDLDDAFKGETPACKRSAYGAANDKLNALENERKEICAELDKTQRELAHLREMLTHT